MLITLCCHLSVTNLFIILLTQLQLRKAILYTYRTGFEMGLLGGKRKLGLGEVESAHHLGTALMELTEIRAKDGTGLKERGVVNQTNIYGGSLYG